MSAIDIYGVLSGTPLVRDEVFLFCSHFITLLFVLGTVIGLAEVRGWVTKTVISHPLVVSVGMTILSFAQFLIFVNSDRLPLASEALYYALAAVIVAACAFGAKVRYRGALLAGLVFLGDASYAIYLSHQIFMGATSKYIGVHIHNTAFLSLFLVLNLVIAALLGTAIHLFAEKPMTRWLRPRKRSDLAAARAAI